MKKVADSISRFLFALVVVVVCFTGAVSEIQAGQQRITVATSDAGESWYFIGGGMIPLVDKYQPALKIATIPGDGSENIRFVSMRSADMGFTVASLAHYGYRREGFFKTLETGGNIRGMFGAYGASSQGAGIRNETRTRSVRRLLQDDTWFIYG